MSLTYETTNGVETNGGPVFPAITSGRSPALTDDDWRANQWLILSNC